MRRTLLRDVQDYEKGIWRRIGLGLLDERDRLKSQVAEWKQAATERSGERQRADAERARADTLAKRLNEMRSALVEADEMLTLEPDYPENEQRINSYRVRVRSLLAQKEGGE